MIKLSVMYPYSPDAHFDYEYYCHTHMPLIKQRMGDRCKYYTVDKGLGGATPGSPPAFVAMCHIYSDSIESLMEGIGPHAAELTADVANFTSLTPVQQISEVLADSSSPSR